MQARRSTLGYVQRQQAFARLDAVAASQSISQLSRTRLAALADTTIQRVERWLYERELPPPIGTPWPKRTYRPTRAQPSQARMADKDAEANARLNVVAASQPVCDLSVADLVELSGVSKLRVERWLRQRFADSLPPDLVVQCLGPELAVLVTAPVLWRCPVNPTHMWKAPAYRRLGIYGGCPTCEDALPDSSRPRRSLERPRNCLSCDKPVVPAQAVARTSWVERHFCDDACHDRHVSAVRARFGLPPEHALDR